MKIFYIVVFALVFSIGGCGYKATTYYTKKVMGKRVFADVDVSIINPEATVMLKDSLNEIVLNKFDANLVSKKESDTQMIASLGNVKLSVLQYDDLGYISMYRATVSVVLRITYHKKTKQFNGSGYYDFAVSNGAISSQTQKLDAIKGASKSALDNIVANIVNAGR